MKKFLLALIICCGLISCNKDNCFHIITSKWDIVQYNDTLLLCIPMQGDLIGRTHENEKPFMINIKEIKDSKDYSNIIKESK